MLTISARWPFVIGVAVLGCGAHTAQAACGVQIDGDPAVVERIRIELSEFPDDTASCLTVWVQARTASEQLEVDVHDELGRSSVRLFSTAPGAAAFIVSWSRRPLPPRIAVIDPDPPEPPMPRLAPPSSVAARVDPSGTGSWHLELDTQGIAASGNHTYWETTTVSLLQRTGFVRYGVGASLMTGWYAGNLVGVAHVDAGLVGWLSSWLSGSVDLVGGLTISGDQTAQDADLGAEGIRGGGRATLDAWVRRSLAIEVNAGLQVLQQHDVNQLGQPASVTYRPCAHVGLGIRWVP